MRLFLAIPIPVHVKKELQRLQPQPAKGLRLIDVNNIHLTLAFIGHEEVKRIETTLESFSSSALVLKLDGVSLFHGKKRSVLWAGLAANKALFKMREALAKCLKEGNINFDQKPWVPHITLAYGNSRVDTAILEKFLNQTRVCASPFQAREIVLYNSITDNNRPSYIAVSHYKLQQ